MGKLAPRMMMMMLPLAYHSSRMPVHSYHHPTTTIMSRRLVVQSSSRTTASRSSSSSSSSSRSFFPHHHHREDDDRRGDHAHAAYGRLRRRPPPSSWRSSSAASSRRPSSLLMMSSSSSSSSSERQRQPASSTSSEWEEEKLPPPPREEDRRRRSRSRRRRSSRIGIIGGGASGMFAAASAADAAMRGLRRGRGGGGTNYDDEYSDHSVAGEEEEEEEEEGGGGCDVIVFEGTSKTMSKVRISGGGRCNVMHDRTKPLSEILASYPRGNRELRGTYTSRFTPDDAYEWFVSRGVMLKTESDGRMFPITDDSSTIVNVIGRAALDAGVILRTRERVERVEYRHDEDEDDDEGGRFVVTLSSRSSSSSSSTSDDAPSPSSGRVEREERFDALILATGSFPHGHEIARSLGHVIVDPVPSLFTLDARDLVADGGTFHGLAGVAVPWARLTLVVDDEDDDNDDDGTTTTTTSTPSDDETNGRRKKKKKKKKATAISQEGPLLITHHGVSGPAALRLSAFAAREFHAVGYRCEVRVHFCPKWEEERMSGKGGGGGGGDNALVDALWETTRSMPKRRVSTGCPLFLKGMVEEASDEGSAAGDSPKSSLPIIPKRLWSALVQRSNIPSDIIWGDASKSMIRSLANNLSSFPLLVTSKGIFKEEFVTAGGVRLNEVHMSNMQSKVTPGLFMCGEVLDVDGVTGGFNFMGCWSTGYVAGEGAVKFCLDDQMLE